MKFSQYIQNYQLEEKFELFQYVTMNRLSNKFQFSQIKLIVPRTSKFVFYWNNQYLNLKEGRRLLIFVGFLFSIIKFILF